MSSRKSFSRLTWFRKQRKAVVSSNDKKMPNGILEEQEQQRVMLLSRSPSGPKKYFPIPVAHLEEEIRVRSADDCKRFREEFNSLPSGHIQGTFEQANKEENREKNRYPNILPNDHSRVILSQVDGTPCSDYINASYIDGYKEKNKFIAAQGPKQETVNDFWRMIWEQKAATIVMLTNLKERKEEKCSQYWPDQGCWTYGNIRVCVEDCVVLVDYTIRKFCIQSQLPDGCKAPRLVSQLHFTSWPDFGVPFTPIGMLKFLKKVKALNPAHAGPIVVHCSAGVGRTGTFVVIDAMMDMMHAEQKVDVFEFVSRIRNQRPQMVQTDMQYTFIYQALLEYYLYGDTELDVSSLEKHLQTLHGTTTHFDKIGLEEEFRKLTNVRIMKENMRTGNLPANMKKARVIQIIPYDFNRVILSMKRGQEYTDYINASFIDGYRQKDYFIATQGPLAHTVEDFWRMVWEWKCHTVVMLTEVQEREQDKCYQYWPTEGSVTHGEITIEIKSDTLSEAISIRDFLVTFNQPLAHQEEQTRMVRQFHFHGWPEVGIPAEGKGMIDLIAAVQKQQQQTGNHPITVHCRYTQETLWEAEQGSDSNTHLYEAFEVLQKPAEHSSDRPTPELQRLAWMVLALADVPTPPCPLPGSSGIQVMLQHILTADRLSGGPPRMSGLGLLPEACSPTPAPSLSAQLPSQAPGRPMEGRARWGMPGGSGASPPRTLTSSVAKVKG
ncbi:receptor-type tyrosine-protein phosphatase epsilon isoform X2 [Zalophus californianus]|uniref:Receptor-type tyrosine-protein phosphatase epsilon n=1 Tax=Zalophus californianus TaxID=9704 RepID=A0A6J2CQZ5_ZALCA|nr:receptor-type tyrosine-protein phosphatase epsilon isoform X2 [Zalophus californianus]